MEFVALVYPDEHALEDVGVEVNALPATHQTEVLERTWRHPAPAPVQAQDEMAEAEYHLIAVKRDWIPEWLYALIVRSFWRSLCVRWPLAWVLHRSLRPGEEE